MPGVDPQKLRWLIPEIAPEDGTFGFLVRRHWASWIPYWLTAIPIGVSVLVSFWLLWWKGAISFADWWTWLLVLGGLYGIVKVVVLWYLKLAREVVLVTPSAVYQQRQDKLFWFTVRVVNTGEIADWRTEVDGWGLLGMRTIIIATKGAEEDIRFEHAAEWETLERGLSLVLARRPE